MRALYLERVGLPAQVREVDDPRLRAAGVVVDVLAVRIPSYTREVFSGELAYDLPVPLVPGPTCVGVVDQVAEDVFHLNRGDVVLCNSFYSSGNADGADDILIGWTGNGTERSALMQRIWRSGSFAEKALYPASCLTVLPEAREWDRPELLAFLASLAIADGGLRRGELRGGQTVVVNGATGNLGGAAVLAALARGAARVVATGRRTEALGTAGLVGGPRHDVPLAYQRVQRRQLTIRGSFMFGTETVAELWQLVRSGALDLSAVTAHRFDLDTFHEGIEKAAGLTGLEYAVLLP